MKIKPKTKIYILTKTGTANVHISKKWYNIRTSEEFFKLVFKSIEAFISTLWEMNSLEKTYFRLNVSSSFLHESTLEWRKTKMR